MMKMEEEIGRENVAAGIEPTISKVEVEGANQCAMLSQTKLCNQIQTYIPFQRPFEFEEFAHRPLLP